jgi:uncharacterized protein YndB with AHSA1/START domain
MNPKKSRSYEKRFEVAAPAEAVWKAITEGDELARWFCQKAHCAPGVGGRQDIDWGGGVRGAQVITAWEEHVHLRTELERPELGEASAAEPYAIDWFLEQEGGVTRVRMVASGFGEGPGWDFEYDGTFHGWDLYHATLIHYLEHHRGEAPANVVIYASLPVPRSEAWRQLMSPAGFVRDGSVAALEPGSAFRFVTSEGDLLEGTVRKYTYGSSFAAEVANLNRAILVLELTSIPGRGDFLYLAVNTWGLAKHEVDALGARLKRVIHGLFPQQSAGPRAACAGE